MELAHTLSDARKDVSDGRPEWRLEVGDDCLNCRMLRQCVEQRLQNAYVVNVSPRCDQYERQQHLFHWPSRLTNACTENSCRNGSRTTLNVPSSYFNEILHSDAVLPFWPSAIHFSPNPLFLPPCLLPRFLFPSLRSSPSIPFPFSGAPPLETSYGSGWSLLAPQRFQAKPCRQWLQWILRWEIGWWVIAAVIKAVLKRFTDDKLQLQLTSHTYHFNNICFVLKGAIV